MSRQNAYQSLSGKGRVGCRIGLRARLSCPAVKDLSCLPRELRSWESLTELLQVGTRGTPMLVTLAAGCPGREPDLGQITLFA